MTPANPVQPIRINRFLTGLYTHRSPLVTPYTFIGMTMIPRNDALLDGLNAELTDLFTVRRRYGFSQFCSQALSSGEVARSLYSYKDLDGNITLVGDFTSNIGIFNADVHTPIYQVTNTAERASFQGVGSMFYLTTGDGAFKWLLGKNLVVLNGAGATLPLTWTIAGTGSPSGSLSVQSGLIAVVPGQTYTVSADIDCTHVALGAPSVNICSADGATSYVSALQAPSYNTRVSATWTCPDAVYQVRVQYRTNSCLIIGGQRLDFSNPMLEKGSTATAYIAPSSTGLTKMGITPPANAPILANTPIACPYASWAANTFYSPNGCIIDSNSNVQKLTTDGTTGASEPTWATLVGATTTDGSAVWTNQGSATWSANTNVALDKLIVVTWETKVWGIIDIDYPTKIYGWIYTSHTCLFKCSTAGKTGNSAPVWNEGRGVTTQDGTAVWTNAGSVPAWSSIGAATLVSSINTLVDSNGALESVYGFGKSGSTVPTWATEKGSATVDGSLTWTNGGKWGGGAAMAPCGYGYAFKNNATTHVSSMSKLASITLLDNSNISVQGDTSTDTQVDTACIYRTKQGGSVYFLLDEIALTPNTSTWQYTDTKSDDDLNVNIIGVQDINNPPPDGLANLCFHAGRLWGSVGPYVYYSTGPDTALGVPEESWAALNYFNFPGKVIALMPSQAGLIVFLEDDVWVIPGTDSGSFYAALWLPRMGVSNRDCIATDSQNIYVYNSVQELWALGTNSDNVGFNVTEVLAANFPAATSSLTVLRSGSADSALYICNGSGGIMRWSLNTQSWSPMWQITGGAGILHTLEVSPQSYQLVTSNGTYLIKRDRTAFTDLDQAFPWWIRIGTLDVAAPGEMTYIQFIAMHCAGAGSTPAVSFLADELNGDFIDIPSPVPEAPLLPQGTTLWGFQYPLIGNQAAKPCEMQHLQIRIDFPAEAYSNEIYELSVMPKGDA